MMIIVTIINCTAHFVLTLAAIPTVIKAKYMINSRGLYRMSESTIDKAPIIPSDNAMLFAIVLVIT